MDSDKKPRQRRIAATQSRARTRRKDRMRIVLQVCSVDDARESDKYTGSHSFKWLNLGWFDRNTANGCRCRCKQHGNPKVGGGMCSRSDGDYRHTVAQRIAGRVLVRKWLREAQYPSGLPDVEL